MILRFLFLLSFSLGALSAAAAERKPNFLILLSDVLSGEKQGRPHETVYWRFGPQWAVRHRDWKLVMGQGVTKPLLIDLTKDISEENDLSAAQPEKVKELRAIYETWNAEQEPPRWLPSENPDKQGKAAKKNKK